MEALAQAGEHIVAQKTIYGGTYNLLAHTLPQYGISATFVDVHDLAAVEAAIQENTRPSIWRLWEIPTATFPTSTPSRRLPTGTACRW